MPKVRSIRRKKRRFRGNRYTKVKNDEISDKSKPGHSEVADSQTSPHASACATAETELSEVATGVSPSAQMKTRQSGSAVTQPDPEPSGDTPVGFRLIDLGHFLPKLLSHVACTTCGNSDFQYEEKKKMGFLSTLELLCKVCEEVVVSCDTSASTRGPDQTRAFPDVNRRFTESFCQLGLKYRAMQRFSAAMDMPCPSKQTYRKHIEALQPHGEEQENVTPALASATESADCT